jgi:GNAT superfamily N-acetyltransferase
LSEIMVPSAEDLIRAAAITTEIVDPESESARWALGEYFAELDRRFPTGFDPGSGGAAHEADLMRSPLGAFVVLRNDSEIVGCGGVQRVDSITGEIKRMWIHDDWRCLGLGGRLLTLLETVVSGLDRVILDTNSSLNEAIAMYLRFGYEPIERYNDNPYAHHWFAKHLST